MTSESTTLRPSLPIIGRENELVRISSLLEHPASDRIDVLLIAGEPGVGKTRLMQEAAAQARDRGWAVVRGHAYESEGMPPYLPFIEALQDYASSSQQEELETRLADSKPELALLVPTLGRSGRQLQGAPVDPETRRYRLYEAVSDLLLKIASLESPAGLLLCLDDLHWADESTLFLVEHFIRKQTSAPVLVLATYRDTELDVSKPLARTLEQLLRLGVASRLDLKRLDREALAALLAVLGGPDPPLSLIDTVFNETEGNPFFVREVFQYLQETDRLQDALGAWRTDLQVTELDLPESVRLVIGGRLARVSERCRQTLSAAAVAGRGVSLVLLQMVVELDEASLLEAVEEAERSHLVAITLDGAEEQLTFAHELIRQTLLAGLSLPRRRRLHGRIARALEERHSAHLDEHAAELAAHFGHSSDPGELKKALDYSERAAEHAMSLYAWAEAARLLERALDLMTLVSPGDKTRRCDLLLRLCDALLEADQPKRVLAEFAEEAFALAEALGDEARASAACQVALMSVFHLAPSVPGRSTPWGARADLLAPEGTVLRVHADGAFAWIEQEHALAQRALKTARELGDPDAFFTAAFFVFSLMMSGTEEACLELATEIALNPPPNIRPRTLFRTLEAASEVLLAWGERDLAERILGELEARADATGEPGATRIAGHIRLSLAAIDGRLEEAVAEAGRLASPETGMLAWRNGFRPLLLLASPEYLRRAEEVLSKLEGPLHSILFALWSVNAGIPFIPQPGPNPMGEQPTFWRTMVLEITVKMLPLDGAPAPSPRRKEIVRTILRLLESATSPATQEMFTLIDRQRGDAYVFLGEPEKAREHFLAALAAGEKMRFRPEVALTRLALAELILDHYPHERAEAFEHLDFCIPEFREMKMQPSLLKAEGLLARRGRSRPRPAVYPAGLSAREVDVLRLIARGLTNQQIAEALTISLNTVLHHVSSIFGKIDAANRTEAAGYAHRHSLIS